MALLALLLFRPKAPSAHVLQSKSDSWMRSARCGGTSYDSLLQASHRFSLIDEIRDMRIGTSYDSLEPHYLSIWQGFQLSFPSASQRCLGT